MSARFSFSFTAFSAVFLLLSACFYQAKAADNMAPDIHGQSFNGETRGVDVTVLSTSNLNITSMIISGLNIRSPHASPEARIYRDTGEVIASGKATIKRGEGQSITIPLSATLAAGKNYRLALFVPEDRKNGGNTGSFLIQEFPYTESSGQLQINQAYSTGDNAFPQNVNEALPMMKIGIKDPSGKISAISVENGDLKSSRALNPAE